MSRPVRKQMPTPPEPASGAGSSIGPDYLLCTQGVGRGFKSRRLQHTKPALDEAFGWSSRRPVAGNLANLLPAATGRVPPSDPALAFVAS